MKTIFNVFRPCSGTYITAYTSEQLIELLAKEAWEVYFTLANGQPCVQVLIEDNGTEVWKSMTGETIPNYNKIANIMQNFTVEPIPVTILGETNAG